MEATKFWCFLTIILSGVTASQAAHWSYTGETGPQHWHKIFPQECSGKHQSPIDISPERTIYNPDLKDFAIWYDPPKKDSKMYLRNNGHTGQVDLEGDFFVTNGGLGHVYKALQFHFHWGHKAHHGSEHRFDGQPSPIELHLVTYNQELYADIGEAVREKGGLAVLGVMYEISEEDNPAMATIVEALKHVSDPEQHEPTELPLLSLRDFLPKDITRYYRYNGSLTTPGCFESVIWTVFDAKQQISHRQLTEFTTLLQFKHKHRGHGSRHRRSLSKGEREKERRAEAVLDELGIRGNEYEEAIFKSELLQEKMMGDMPKDDAVVKVPDSSSKPAKPELIPTLDEQRAAEIDQAIDDHAGENDITNRKADTHHSKKEKEVLEAEEEVYMQEVIVNNFRPVQPLNDRIVYRSFKLRDDIASDDGKLGQSQSEKFPPCKPSDNDNGNAAGHLDLNIAAILTVLSFSLFLT